MPPSPRRYTTVFLSTLSALRMEMGYEMMTGDSGGISLGWSGTSGTSGDEAEEEVDVLTTRDGRAKGTVLLRLCKRESFSSRDILGHRMLFQ